VDTEWAVVRANFECLDLDLHLGHESGKEFGLFYIPQYEQVLRFNLDRR
jgi:hypothetical protein